MASLASAGAPISHISIGSKDVDRMIPQNLSPSWNINTLGRTGICALMNCPEVRHRVGIADIAAR
jgi:hypothetical protein